MLHAAPPHRNPGREERRHEPHSGRRVVRGILVARDRQFLAAARGEFRALAAAAPVDLQTRPSGRVVPGDGAACRLAVHLRHGLAPARDPALQSRRASDETFVALDQHIRRTWRPSSLPIAFRFRSSPGEKYLYYGEIVDQRCLNRSRWILGVRAATGEVDIIGKTPQLVKVCSSRVRSRTGSPRAPGMALTHMPTPPSGGIGQGGFPILQHQQRGSVLGPHRADQARGSLCPRRVAGS